MFSVRFELITDHEPLKYLRNLSNASPRLVNWRMKMESYSYKVDYKKGEENTNADALLRIEQNAEVNAIQNEAVNAIGKSPATKASEEESEINGNLIGKRIELADIQKWQREDEAVNKLIKETERRRGKFNNLVIEDGILYSLKKKMKEYEPQGTKRLVVPEILKATVLTVCHDEMAGAHLGERKTWSKVSSKFFWPNMKEEIEFWIKSCKVCAAKKSPPPSKAPMHPLTEPERPFERIGIDFLGPFPATANGNSYILNIIDYGARWAESFPTKDMKVESVARILVDEIVCRHGAPDEILSDQGKSFLAEVVAEVCEYFKTKKINSTPYHPETNGLTERFNGTLCDMLSTYVVDRQRDWNIFLPIVLFAYRTSVQSTTQETPFRLLYGRDARLPSDLEKFIARTSFVDKIDQAWKEAWRNIMKVAEKAKSRSDESHKVVEYKVGDRVRLHRPATKVGLNRKLRKDWYAGPYEIVQVNNKSNAEIEINGNRQGVHVNRLKKAEWSREAYSSVRSPVTTRYGRVSRQPQWYGTEETPNQ